APRPRNSHRKWPIARGLYTRTCRVGDLSLSILFQWLIKGQNRWHGKVEAVETRLKTWVWVQAFLRQLETDGYMAALLSRGDDDAGAVLVKVNRFTDGCRVYTQVRTELGELAWLAGTGSDLVPESDADSYIGRQRKYDADIWVIEVEDPKGTYGIDGVVLED
ncbi:MAG: DUF1491 family protein, partial [Rhodospirillaceae bacterium]